jgi:DNA polymerase-3 subunit delta'
MSWDRIRGHDAVCQQFEAAIAAGRLGQAYLFVGPHGVGKKLFAAELAKALLCESATGFAACGRCVACKLCDAGTHPDFHTFGKPDDKQVITVDVIDERVHPFLFLKSSRGTRKVCVLDDGDVFHEDAANKFLKTLEEPPPGCLLIILATSIESQLSTILSRCQIVRFKPLASDDVLAILSANGVEDPSHADRLARLAAGSPGLALELADPAVWAFRESLLSAVSDPKVRATALIETWVRFIEDAGKEAPLKRRRASQTLKFALDFVRRATRLAVGSDADGLSETDRGRALSLAGKFGPDGLIALAEALDRADDRIGANVPVPIVVETVSDRFARPHSVW